MPLFEPGHKANEGKKFETALVKRRMKRMEKNEAKKIVTQTNPKSLANLISFAPGHAAVPGAGNPKKTSSIKERLHEELKKQGSSLEIARRLILMAKAGDIKAIELIMERMDGKVPQALSGDKDN